MSKQQARDVSLDVLVRIERHKSYSNIELNHALARTALSRVDRGLVTELVYGTIQRRNTLDWILKPFVRTGLDRLDVWVRELLRMSVYQIQYLDKIPPRAAVHEAVEIAKRRGRRGVAGFVNAVLRNVLRQKDRLHTSGERDLVSRLALLHSHPEWLVKRWLRVWDPDVVAKVCEANNAAPKHTIRVNTLKTDRETLRKQLEAEEPAARIRLSPITSQGLITGGQGNLANRSAYRRGMYSIQDESSMLVGEVVQPAPGATVLDMCAAPGGKAAHLAELMENRGSVAAYDVHRHKVKLLDAEARRLGLHIIKAEHGDARELPCRAPALYDYVLLDAPCSGLGVIRRKPEIKWRQTERDITQLAELQRELLDAASQMVKPGGVLVYSTCTLEPKENELQIASFLKRHPQFKPDKAIGQQLPDHVITKAALAPGMLRILPHYFNSDGFFIARLTRRA